MANPSNTFDFVNETLAQFLAKAVSDGTQADVFNTLKTDAPGNEAVATAISTVNGQILSNGVDDFVQKVYGPIRDVSRQLATEFGVVADGATDDTAAMQLFINAGGGQLPGGVILTTDTLDYFTDTVLIGKGIELTEIRFQPASSIYALDTFNSGVNTFGLRISRLKITYTSTAAGGIHLQRMSDARIEQIAIDAITNSTGNAIRGFGGASTVRRNVIEQVHITDALNAVQLDAGVDGFLVHGCTLDNCITGCRATAALGMRVVTSKIINGTNAVTIQATSSGNADGCVVMGNHFEGNTTNVNVAGTAANVRGLVVANNFHADGTQYAAVFTTTRPSVIGDSSPTATTDSLLSGDLAYRRAIASQGTTLVTGDVALSAGWGATATVSAIKGTDAAGFIEVTPGGAGLAANATITLTFTDGAWSVEPAAMVSRNDFTVPTAAASNTKWVTTTTTLVITADMVPTGAVVYRYDFQCIGL